MAAVGDHHQDASLSLWGWMVTSSPLAQGLPEVPWVLALTVLCPQVDVVEGSLMGLPGERGPIGPKGSKVCGWSEKGSQDNQAGETSRAGAENGGGAEGQQGLMASVFFPTQGEPGAEGERGPKGDKV